MADDVVIDGQGGNVIIGADGTVTVVPLTPEDIAQRQSDQADGDAKRAVRAARDARLDTFRADPDRADWLTQLQTATLPQVEAYVRGKV